VGDAQAHWYDGVNRGTAATYHRYLASRVNARHSTDSPNPILLHYGHNGPSGLRGEMAAQAFFRQQFAMAYRPTRGHCGHLGTPCQAWENGRKLRKCPHQSGGRGGIMREVGSGELGFSLTLTYRGKAGRRDWFGVRAGSTCRPRKLATKKRINGNTCRIVVVQSRRLRCPDCASFCG
jgi:hypothetical protein